MNVLQPQNPSAFHFPTTGISIERSSVLLAIDDALLPLKKNICLYLSKPEVRAEPVLTPSTNNPNAPDALAAHFYGTVLQDEGKFRMWYYPCSFKDNGPVPEGASLQWYAENMNQGPVCYAESDDGLEWLKPSLGQVEFKGSRENNAIALSELPIEGVTLLKDDDDPDPQRRYKMVYNAMSPKGYFSSRTATSADGISWQVAPECPIDAFVEQASFYKHNGMYFINAQSASPFIRSEGGNDRGRQAIAWISPDFDHWLQESAESFILPEPANPAERGIPGVYDQVHIGVGAASLGNVVVGFYCVWHNKPNTDDWFGTGTTSGDLVLVVSNDGITFREPVKNHIYLARSESAVTPVNGVYETVLCQANGIINVGDETRIYHGRWRNPADTKYYYGEVALATLPRDRWGALGLFPDQEVGSLWSAPITLPQADCQILLNADGADGMRVEVADARFNLMPEYSGANSGRCASAQGIECAVQWPASELSALAGQTVRLRVHLQRSEGRSAPRLYAVYLRC